MKVKFKKNQEPCIQYEVRNNIPVIEWDGYLEKYCECIEIEMIGLVPIELLAEASHPDNIDAIDMAVHLTNTLKT